MSNVYSIDVKIYATAYIRADSEAEALKIAKAMKDDCLELCEQDGDPAISGLNYDNPDLPGVSLSPAMTIYGPDEGDLPDCVHEGGEEDDMEGTAS